MKKLFFIIMLIVMFVLPYNSFADSSASASIDNVSASAGTSSVITDSFNSQGYRGFAIPGDVAFGPTLNYFGHGNPSAAMQDVRSFLVYSETFTEGALEEILNRFRKPRTDFKIVNRDVELASSDQDGVKWIKIVVLTDEQGRMKRYENAQMIGYVVSESKHKTVTMLEVLASAALEAIRNGCNVLQITAQGSVNDVESSGWGIGIHSTQAQVYSSGQDKSNVSSAGLGYSTGTAGIRNKPWLQAVGLVDYDLKFKRARIHSK